MLNTSLRSSFTLLLFSPLAPTPSPLLSPPPPAHGDHPGLMFLFHAFPYVSFLFLLIHLISILLLNLFSILHRRAISNRDEEFCIPCHEDAFLSNAATSGDLYGNQGIGSDSVLEEEALLFFFNGCHNKDDTLLADQGRDSQEQFLIAKGDAFVHDYTVDYLLPTVSASVSLDAVNNIIDGRKTEEGKHAAVESPDFDKTSKLEEEEEAHPEKVTFRGDSLAGESTSDSSIDRRSSTIFRDSETEYPFSSSSRRSSSNWESYTLFRKYDEEMSFFDKISARKLAETESFRSKNDKRASIPKRIIGKLIAKPKSGSAWDPYQELESAYVAQVCLAWEVLSWNYKSFRKARRDGDMDGSCCQARIAQKFQQFQVLLQRFIESEPYEYGRRPEIFARMRSSSPKLLHVPEFLCDEENQEQDSKISSTEFLSILEDSIRTFMDFLKADKKRFKLCIKRKQSISDINYLRLLKKINKKKKLKLEEIGRRGKYWKKWKIKEEEEMEAFMAMIDLKVVSRVLRVEQITEEQLHWCEDKMSKVRVWDGKMKRDEHSPLFFPV